MLRVYTAPIARGRGRGGPPGEKSSVLIRCAELRTARRDRARHDVARRQMNGQR